LTGGRTCVIFQLIDDHSRYAVASHVAWGETAEAAIIVVDKGIAAHGVPQRLLTDNGVALNPSRRGYFGQLVTHLGRIGVETITGKPYKPTTQGKNERFHQTLFRWLDAQPLASSLDELQAQVDAFDQIYNTERPHQGLPGRVTPATAWLATPKADPPRPHDNHPVVRQLRDRQQPDPARMPPGLPAGTILRKLTSQGTFTLDQVRYLVDVQRGFDDVLIVQDDNQIMVVDLNGEILLETTRPAPGTTYVGRLHGNRPHIRGLSPKS
jgi:putative transposase